MNLWVLYTRGLARRPLPTKMLTAGTLAGAGDALAQTITHRRQQSPDNSENRAPETRLGQWLATWTDWQSPLPEWYDAVRTLRFITYGTLWSGPVGHLWFGVLESRALARFGLGPGSSLGAGLRKMAVDQVCMTPVMTAWFFFAMESLSCASERLLYAPVPDKPPPAETWAQESWKRGSASVANRWLPTLTTNYAIWPAVVAGMFWKVPVEHRVAVASFFGLGWSAYLSLVQNSGASRAPR